MPKGHRRTQSSNLVLSVPDNPPPPLQEQTAVGGHEIATLLARSNEKVKEKVSNVEVLHSQSMPENSFFAFGKGNNRFSENGRTKNVKLYLYE